MAKISYTEFEKNLLVAAYLTSEELGKPTVSVNEIVQIFEFELKSNWTKDALSYFWENQLSKEQLFSGTLSEQRIWLNRDGKIEAERLIETGVMPDRIAKDSAFDGLVGTKRSNSEASTETPPLESLDGVKSASWTGPQLILVDSVMISEAKRLAAELHQAVFSMKFQSNSESHDLKRLAEALVVICDMAEPEISIIDRITASPKFKHFASLVSIIATIRGAVGL